MAQVLYSNVPKLKLDAMLDKNKIKATYQWEQLRMTLYHSLAVPISRTFPEKDVAKSVEEAGESNSEDRAVRRCSSSILDSWSPRSATTPRTLRSPLHSATFLPCRVVSR